MEASRLPAKPVRGGNDVDEGARPSDFVQGRLPSGGTQGYGVQGLTYRHVRGSNESITWSPEGGEVVDVRDAAVRVHGDTWAVIM